MEAELCGWFWRDGRFTRLMVRFTAAWDPKVTRPFCRAVQRVVRHLSCVTVSLMSIATSRTLQMVSCPYRKWPAKVGPAKERLLIRDVPHRGITKGRLLPVFFLRVLAQDPHIATLT